MVQLRVSSGVLAKLGRPPASVSAHVQASKQQKALPDHLPDEPLLGRLLGWEAAQQSQQLCLGGGIGLRLGLVVDIEQEEAQVAAAAALARLQQQLCARREDVDGGFPVRLLDVARADDAQLLVRFVELALGDPKGCGARGVGQRLLCVVLRG